MDRTPATSSLLLLFFVTLTVLMVLSAVAMQDAKATHTSKASTRCSVDIESVDTIPIIYMNATRSNPDGTVYPGDAFHYLLRVSGLDECLSFTVPHMEADGAYNIVSSSIIINRDVIPLEFDWESARDHPVTNFEHVPKYLKTTHYHVKTHLGYETNHCVHQNCKITTREIFSLSEPFLSVREDRTLATHELKRVFKEDRYGRFVELRDGIAATQTSAWGLTKVRTVSTPGGEGHTMEDQSSANLFERKVSHTCATLGRYEGCVFGHVEIDARYMSQVCLLSEMRRMNIGIPAGLEDHCVEEPDQIRQEVRGTYRLCSGSGSDDTCKTKTVADSVTDIQPIVSPDFPVLFEYPQMIDLDGYYAKNDDGTYYVHDPATIHHMPDLPFREYRNGTLVFETVISPVPLKKMQRTDCSDGFCSIVIRGIGMTPSTHDAKNGDGITVFNATSLELLGLHAVHYDVKLRNIGTQIYRTQADAQIHIVNYNPVYGPIQQYLNYNLTDNNIKYYSMAISYLGSAGNKTDSYLNPTGGATDEKIYPDRRSKINYMHHVSVGERVRFLDNLNFDLNRTDLGISADILGGNTTLSLHGGSDIAKMHPPQSVTDTIPAKWQKHTDSLGPKKFSSLANDTGMFYGRGFGRMLYTVNPDIQKTAFDGTFVNFTSYNTAVSANFGGYDKTYLFHEKYTHTPDNISVMINVTSIRGDGSVNYGTDLHVTLVPRMLLDQTEYVPQYIVGHDHTGNMNITMMHVSDVHDIANTATGTGQVVFYANKSTVYIDGEVVKLYDFRDLDAISDAVLPLVNLTSPAYRPGIAQKDMLQFVGETNKDQGYHALSEYFWHNANGVYDLEITANGITNVIPLHIVDFSSPISYTLNQDQKNVLKTGSILGVTNIPPDEGFGEISSVTVDGEKYDTDCFGGCIVVHETAGKHLISATNIWGGRASATLDSRLSDAAAGKTGFIDEIQKFATNPWVVITVMLLLGVVIASRAWRAYEKYS